MLAELPANLTESAAGLALGLATHRHPLVETVQAWVRGATWLDTRFGDPHFQDMRRVRQFLQDLGRIVRVRTTLKRSDVLSLLDIRFVNGVVIRLSGETPKSWK